MSKRKALRSLLAKFPTPDEVTSTLDNLGKESDRVVAIVGVALLESALEKILEKKLVADSSEMRAQLFINKGPLSDFHSKILVAEAFGFIHQSMAKELNDVKAIRNVFAHSRMEVSFQTKEVEEMILESQIVQILKRPPLEHLEGPEANKRYFALLLHLLFVLLDAEVRNQGGDPLLRLATEV